MKNKIFILLLLIFSISLYSENLFNQPLRIEPASVFTKIRIDAKGDQKSTKDNSETTKSLGIEGELSFLKLISIKAAGGRSIYENKGSSSVQYNTPGMFGLKIGKDFGSSSGAFAIGAGLKVFDKPSKRPELKRNDTANSFYLVRPNLSMGFRFRDFEAHTEFQFQTETSSKFKEGSRDEFKRHYQAGLSLSQGFLGIFRVYLETEYRVPYNKKIDTNALSWNFYPGISIAPYKGGLISISGMIPVMRKEYAEKGILISFMHFF